jgi:hypothetical protein
MADTSGTACFISGEYSIWISLLKQLMRSAAGQRWVHPLLLKCSMNICFYVCRLWRSPLRRLIGPYLMLVRAIFHHTRLLMCVSWHAHALRLYLQAIMSIVSQFLNYHRLRRKTWWCSLKYDRIRHVLTWLLVGNAGKSCLRVDRPVCRATCTMASNGCSKG